MRAQRAEVESLKRLLSQRETEDIEPPVAREPSATRRDGAAAGSKPEDKHVQVLRKEVERMRR
jgi:hypothetical protein